MALEIYLEGTLNGEDVAGNGDVEADMFDFADRGTDDADAGGFTEVSGLGAEITVAEYREGTSHTPEWTDHNDADPGGSTYHPDSEWRYVPVRRTQAEGDEDAPVLWDDGLF